MPFRRMLIAVLILLGLAGYLGARQLDDEEPPDGAPLQSPWDGDVTMSRSAHGLAFETTPSIVPPSQVTIAVPLDPAGRPYDQYLEPGATVDRLPLVRLHAPTRRALFMAGEETTNVRPGEYRPVRLAERAGREYPVDAIWLYVPGQERKTVGVAIVEHDSPVVRWRQLADPAYTTHHGFGGITTVEWSAFPKGVNNPVERAYRDKLRERGLQTTVVNADGHPGTDTVIFRTGPGDGSYPSFAGFDASGRRAQIVLWSQGAPWRLAFPTGTPPVQVTRRENHLRACLRGRALDGGSPCRPTR